MEKPEFIVTEGFGEKFRQSLHFSTAVSPSAGPVLLPRPRHRASKIRSVRTARGSLAKPSMQN